MWSKRIVGVVIKGTSLSLQEEVLRSLKILMIESERCAMGPAGTLIEFNSTRDKSRNRTRTEENQDQDYCLDQKQKHDGLALLPVLDFAGCVTFFKAHLEVRGRAEASNTPLLCPS